MQDLTTWDDMRAIINSTTAEEPPNSQLKGFVILMDPLQKKQTRPTKDLLASITL
jgi:hypothetical protein